jgi:hypothetical protein
MEGKQRLSLKARRPGLRYEAGAVPNVLAAGRVERAKRLLRRQETTARGGGPAETGSHRRGA